MHCTVFGFSRYFICHYFILPVTGGIVSHLKYLKTKFIMEHDKIVQRINAVSLAISLSLTALGAALLFIVQGQQVDPASSLYMVGMTTGVVLMMAGVVRAVWWSRRKVYSVTNSRVGEHSVYLTSLEQCISAIEKEDAEALMRLSGDQDSGVRLDVAFSSDNAFGACQVYRYVPHSFEVATGVYEISEKNLKPFISAINEIKRKQST